MRGRGAKRPFYATCVGWPGDVDDLIFLQDEADEITREEFLALVDEPAMRSLERGLGYNKAIPMSGDYHVGYRIHRESGIPFFIHSAIEHVFATEADIEALNEQRIASESEPEEDEIEP